MAERNEKYGSTDQHPINERIKYQIHKMCIGIDVFKQFYLFHANRETFFFSPFGMQKMYARKTNLRRKCKIKPHHLNGIS